MKYNEAKTVANIIKNASQKLQIPFETFMVKKSFVDDSRYEVYAYSRNTAYRHELNSLILALDGLMLCSCYQIVNHNHMPLVHDGEIIWHLF